MIVRGMYCGPIAHLEGATALLQHRGDCTLAQFDNTALSRFGLIDQTDEDWELSSLGFNWHSFPTAHFYTIPGWRQDG